jgi:glycerol kinase
MEYILSLDQGTTSSRAILFDRNGKIVHTEQEEFAQVFPRQGWVEHRPADIWITQIDVARAVLDNNDVGPEQITGIGITNQRETTIAWDRTTGVPVYNAIVWQDRRTADLCDTLRDEGHEPLFRQKTGLVLDSYFSGTKLHWLLENTPEAKELAEEGDLAVGTVDSWLIWKLTGGRHHVTDVTNASRTLLYNIHKEEWDSELLDILDIPHSVLPEVKPSSKTLGETDPDIFGEPIPIAGVAGDQQAALFGQMCWSRGEAKNTYGTGCFLLMNTGGEPVHSEHRLLTTIAWSIDGRTQYAMEGSVFIGGAVVQWLRDKLGIIEHSSDVEELAQSVSSNDGVYMVPAFTGLGAPHWDPDARGTITGITRGSTDAHIARAALESIAHQSTDVIETMEKDSGIHLKELRVDGGASENDFLMQFQSDLLDCPVIRPDILESTARGAAFLAGLAVGFWNNRSDIKECATVDSRFHRTMSDGDIREHRNGWRNALNRTLTDRGNPS